MCLANLIVYVFGGLRSCYVSSVNEDYSLLGKNWIKLKQNNKRTCAIYVKESTDVTLNALVLILNLKLFCWNFQSIIDETEGELNDLLSLQEKSTKEFRETVKFFGEKPSSATTEDFFGIFAAFIMNFEASGIKLLLSICKQTLTSARSFAFLRGANHKYCVTEKRRILPPNIGLKCWRNH